MAALARWRRWVRAPGVLAVVCVATAALVAAPGTDADPVRSATFTPADLGCLAMSLYWEARGEGRDGMVAVAWVVLNRLRHPAFPDTVCEVIKDGGETPPCQFSFWCDGRADTPAPGAAWELAQQVARQMLSDPEPDLTGGALYFHASWVSPEWALELTTQLGRHLYYR